MMQKALVCMLLCSTLAGLSSCGLSADEADTVRSCSGGCGYSIGWPRLIVGVIPPEGSNQEDVELVTVTGATQPDGKTTDFLPHFCPSNVSDTIICSYSLMNSPLDRSVAVNVRNLNGMLLAQADVQLEEFNRCGIDVAYMTVTLNQDESAKVSAVRYVTACGGALDPR